MEDENGLELSLGLSCGKSSSIPKAANGGSSDTRTEEGDRGSKIIDDFKNFLHGGTQKQDSGLAVQKSDPVKPEENFFDNLSNPAVNVDASTNLSSAGLWVVNNNRSSEVEEEKRLEAGSKRKNLLNEINHQKKRERDSDKTRASHISITTDEGSTAENEDVADSEAEGSTSRPVPLRDDVYKRHAGGSGSSAIPKEVHVVSGSTGLEKGQSRFTISTENDFKFRNISYGAPFTPQPLNILNMPYKLPVKDSNPGVAPGSSNYVLPGMIHMVGTSNSERPANQHMIPANFPLMFGYSPVQLPVLDKDNSQGLVPHSQQLHSSYIGRGLLNSDKQNDGLKISEATTPVIPHKSPETKQYEGKVLEIAKGEGKHDAAEEGSSSQNGDNAVKQSGIIVGANTPDQPRAEGSSSELQSIRPGIAGDVKFGGSGSVPNLPWVSTTGSGPKGRTISGVTYRFSSTQIRIVCACHGSHMSPEEFVQHASEDQQTNQEMATGVALQSSNSAASAQS